MVGWHHPLSGDGLEPIPGGSVLQSVGLKEVNVT